MNHSTILSHSMTKNISNTRKIEIRITKRVKFMSLPGSEYNLWFIRIKKLSKLVYQKNIQFCEFLKILLLALKRHKYSITLDRLN